tara:strand:+ start:599 stop:1273 length:675 start_codon:yes stop_codon:yes gene_type:complete
MKDLNINAEQLVKTEIDTAYKLDKNAVAIGTQVKAYDTKQGQLRTKVRKSLAKLSVDGKSQADLATLELLMNYFKVNKKAKLMKTLKSTIEWCYNDLVKDTTEQYFTKENRKSMKNVTLNDNTPCVMSKVLPAIGGNKKADTVIEFVNGNDIVLNLTIAENELFITKNVSLFDRFCEIDTSSKLVVTKGEFDYYFDNVVSDLRKELEKARLIATKPVKKQSNTK